jgi:hypothetical protein
MKTVQRAILAFLLAASPVFAADGIAFITNLKGEVAVDGNPRPVLLAELAKGQKLTVGRDSHASVMYIASGKEYILKGPGDFQVKETEVAGAIMPPVTRSTEWRASSKVLTQVAQTSAASVRMRSIAPAKAETGARLSFPSEGSIATLQPTFRWRADDAKAQGDFILAIVGQDKPVHAAKAAGGTYRVPAKLRPETEYSWVVTSAGSEIGAGKFRTLSNEALGRIEKRRPSDRAEFSDRLLFALLLQEMGATQEARESWGRLAQERTDLPELSALAK